MSNYFKIIIYWPTWIGSNECYIVGNQVLGYRIYTNLILSYEPT